MEFFLNKPIVKFNLLLLITIPLLYSENIYILYLCLLFVLLLGLKNSSEFKFLVGVLFVYMFVGLLPISSYRGDFTFATYKIYILFLYLLILSNLVSKFFIGLTSINSSKKKFTTVWTVSSERLLLFFIFSSWLFTFLIYIKSGNVFFNQELRFSISPLYALLVKSGLYVAFILLCVVERDVFKSKKLQLYLFLLIIPTLLIGSRGNVVLLGLAYLLYALKSDNPFMRNMLTKKRILKFSLILFAFINIVFYIRRSGSGSFISTDEMIQTYFYYDNLLIYLITPLHIAFRETIGIANSIMDRELYNYILDYPLVFAELLTVLPGEQMAPGVALGQIIGAVGAGGLTPGLLGGVYLDYGITGIVFVSVLFGFIFSVLNKLSNASHIWRMINILTVVQFIHLFHRGFLKPEYIIPYFIIILFMFFLNKRKV